MLRGPDNCGDPSRSRRAHGCWIGGDVTGGLLFEPLIAGNGFVVWFLTIPLEIVVLGAGANPDGRIEANRVVGKNFRG
jgi:hypothetical protein